VWKCHTSTFGFRTGGVRSGAGAGARARARARARAGAAAAAGAGVRSYLMMRAVRHLHDTCRVRRKADS
jgi:hypothetical protein